MLSDARIAEIERLRQDPAAHPVDLKGIVDDLLAERTELMRVWETALRLVTELPDCALEWAREGWGNTNAAVVKLRRDEVRAALGVEDLDEAN